MNQEKTESTKSKGTSRAAKLNYVSMINRYMKIVDDTEGTDFLDGEIEELSEEEVAELKRIMDLGSTACLAEGKGRGKSKVNYKSILIRYLDIVLETEGTDFLDGDIEGFSIRELRELYRLAGRNKDGSIPSHEE